MQVQMITSDLRADLENPSKCYFCALSCLLTTSCGNTIQIFPLESLPNVILAFPT